jgi:hypothetical protein
MRRAREGRRNSVYENQWQADYLERMVREHPRQEGETYSDWLERVQRIAGLKDVEEVPPPVGVIDPSTLPYKDPDDDLDDLVPPRKP